MRRLLGVAAVAVVAVVAPAVPASAGCTGTEQVALCSEAGCTDACHWDIWVECEVPKADPVCSLVDPT